MKSLCAGAFLCLLLGATLASAADERDPIAKARLLYNQREYAAAISAAEVARLIPGHADSADLIAARAYLERFRQSAAPDDLANARDRLKRLDPQRFGERERVELVVGLGETLYFDESYGAAADLFGSVLDRLTPLSMGSRERILDWWASAIDRDAAPRLEIDRQGMYQRIRDRMKDELRAETSSGVAGYWLAAAAHRQGDVQGAWDAAQAGWVRAPLAADRGAELRADLDRLVLVALVPDLARTLAQPPEAIRLEWERFKDRWTKE